MGGCYLSDIPPVAVRDARSLPAAKEEERRTAIRLREEDHTCAEISTQRTLTAAQERTIQRLVADKTPDQRRMSFALWTRAVIGTLIHQRYGIRMPVRTIGHYLRRWDFTPRKPLKRVYETAVGRDSVLA